jgi:hypothetical protein
MEMELAMIVDLMFCWNRLLSGVMQQMNLLAKGRNMIFQTGISYVSHVIDSNATRPPDFEDEYRIHCKL